jgi:hypothetical protein
MRSLCCKGVAAGYRVLNMDDRQFIGRRLCKVNYELHCASPSSLVTELGP